MIVYKEFEFNQTIFSPHELEAIELMKQMLKICGSIYDKQIDKNHPGSNFYPHDVTKDEILKAAEENPQVIDPYTIVKKEGDLLIIVPYSIEYSTELKEIRDLALKAANIVEEQNLKGYLIRLAKACEDDSWEELENYWLTTDGNSLDFQLAPIEGYMDGVLNIKQSFQGTLRISSDSTLFNPDGYIETVKAINFTSLHDEPEVGYQIIVRVDDVIASGGHTASDPSIGSNYPNSDEKVKEFGTKIILYASNVIAKQEKTLLPILKKVMEPSIIDKFTQDEYFASFVRNLMVHEIAESFIKYPNTPKRLKDMQLPIQELHSSLMGLKIAAQQVLQGAITSRDYEVMLITAFIGKAFYFFYKNENPEEYSKGLEHYIRGYTVVLNYMKQKGAIVIDSTSGLIHLNFAVAFACLDELAMKIDDIKGNKTDKEAKELFNQYEDTSIYEDFRSKVLE